MIVAAQLFGNAISASAIFLLVGIGFGLVLRTNGFFHMAHGGVIVAAPYAVAVGLGMGLFPWLSLALGLGLAAILGAGLELAVYRPLRRRDGNSLSLLIVSLGCMIAIQNGLALFFGNDIKTLRRGAVQEGFDFFGVRITEIQFVSIVVAMLLLCGLYFFSLKTQVGLMFRAVGDDRELAEFIGVKTELVMLGAIVLASLIGGIGAVFVAYDTGFTPQVGFDLLLTAVAVALVGGVGSLRGMIIAAILIALLREICGWYIDTSFRAAATFALLIVFLLFRPRGISGALRSRGEG